MGLIKEPKNVDFSVKSEPWTAEELVEFRKRMATIRKKYNSKKAPAINKARKAESAA